ncbi:CTAG/Pcc1 family [Myxozyma melibiosi]|uniref:CTAG/Pcc1 family n=1 Tax=Myxozyma melibiosi TaxID=54550 RepID=A0ABR1F760_9ASCO
MMILPSKLTLTIPFPSYRYASLAYKALSPDPVLKPDQFDLKMSVLPCLSIDSNTVDSSSSSSSSSRSSNGSEEQRTAATAVTKLVVEFAAATDRVLRVGVNGFFESLIVVVECFNAFEGDGDEGVVDGKPVVFE